jgi:maltose alpha-D-glucosyltransferase/alpha-amylase
MTRKDLWYKEAIVYAVDVRTYLDSDGDGVGDFIGLTQKLDHISTLGATCLWLLPFYPSPERDYGYDVTDHYGVHPRYGNTGDFVEFVREAHLRGLRVVIDLVINHTSDQHPWFQAAISSPDSPFRDYYFFRQQPPDNPNLKQVVFDKNDHGPWTYDEKAKASYLHRFYSFEPELNTDHPAVRAEIEKIIQYWTTLGVDGFRIDAAPYLSDKPSDTHHSARPHEILRSVRDYATSFRGDVALMAEADVAPENLPKYTGDGHEVHMLFNFYVNNFFFLALARQKAEPIRRAYDRLPPLPDIGQWLNWVRNHDELDLEQLSESEREEVYQAFAPDENMRIYGRGIRRRFPPMVNGDQRCMEMAYSLMLSLPGTPIIRTGEEIGMGDDLNLEERWSVRTPMQWTHEKNGGFSRAEPDQLVLPVISDGPFSYKKVNVADQRIDPSSFLNWFSTAIRARRQCPECGWARFEGLNTDKESVLAHSAGWDRGRIVALHNLSADGCRVHVDLDDLEQHRFIEVFSDHRYDDPRKHQTEFELAPYGYRWFRLDGTLR